MPAFQSKTVKFSALGGMNWNRSIDTIPDGQICYGRNIRVNQQGEITSRPGLTAFATLTGSPAYTHSNSRLNNYSGNLPFFSDVYVVGADSSIYVGKTSADFANGGINPIKLPPGGVSTSSMSGNPLTMVDAMTYGGASGWKYVGDSTQMLAVGYYPGDTPGTNMARAITMGLLPPVNTIIPTVGGVGNLTGNYQWMFVYRRVYTGARSNPSAPTRVTLASPSLTLSSQAANFTLPLTPPDPLVGPLSHDSNIVVDVYRFGGTVQTWKLVGTGPSGASFTDNLGDSQIQSAASPSEFVDPVTGLTRFDLFQPFPIPDSVRFGTGKATLNANNVWTVEWQSGDGFNAGLLQGSQFSINNQLFTIFQVRVGGASTLAYIELTEDATGILTNGSVYNWAIPSGQLIMGSPCSHIWGPFGVGEFGSVIFGCGNLNAPGTLFWTNGNDPDSTDIANSLVVTSPSERLMGGCLFNGVAYCFSTERMFEIIPSSLTTGQFYVQEIAGGKGLWMEWSLTIQSNDIADQSITWRGKDGIYNFSTGGGTQSLTDDTLYPFFPHENQPGVSPTSLFSLLTAETVPVPDDSQPKYHRMQWFDGVLYYDYVGSSSGNKYRTLVFDSKQAQGWISVDYFFASGTQPVSRSSEIGANNLKISIGSNIYDFTGSQDTTGNAISCRLVTKQDDCGDARGEKLFGDLMIDLDPGGSGGAIGTLVYVLTDYGATTQPNSGTYTVSGRSQSTLDFSTSGLGSLSRTFGLDIQWTAAGAATVLYQYVFSWVPKPEITGVRALDKTDDGWNGSKYVRGFCIECNTFLGGTNQTRFVNVLLDGSPIKNPLSGNNIFAISSGANAQIELPFAITPTVATELQLAIDATDAAAYGWEVFSVRWVWEKYPDLTMETTAFLYPLGNDREKQIRGFILPANTAGEAVTFDVIIDSSTVVEFSGTYALSAAAPKTPVPIAFIPPVFGHSLQLRPKSNPWAIWPDEIQWDAEIWPEFIQEYSPWIKPMQDGKPASIRGFTMPIETNGNQVYFQLRLEDNTVISLGSFKTEAGIKTPSIFVVLPNSLGKSVVVSHVARIEPVGPARCWYDEITWDAEEYPELSVEESPILDCGYGRAKFMQGVVVPIDTNGVGVQFQFVNIDTGLVAYQSPAITTSGKQAIAFSFPPFIAHLLRIIPLGNARMFLNEAVWIFEPSPELATIWQTPVVTHRMSGYIHQRLFWIAYVSTSAIAFTRSFPGGATENYNLPSSGGIYAKVLLPVLPSKFLAAQYGATSSTGFRLYLQDCEFHTKPWGSAKQSYRVERIIGSPSVNKGADI